MLHILTDSEISRAPSRYRYYHDCCAITITTAAQKFSTKADIAARMDRVAKDEALWKGNQAGWAPGVKGVLASSPRSLAPSL